MMMEGFSMTTMRNESEREDRFVPALGWRGGKRTAFKRWAVCKPSCK